MAVLILATVMISLYGAFSYGFMTIQACREDLRATQILMQQTEAIRLCTWSQLTNYNFQESYDPFGAANAGGGTRYSGTVAVQPASAIPDSATYKTNMRQVAVTVYWTNTYGNSPLVHSRQMKTQVARYGLKDYIWGKIQ